MAKAIWANLDKRGQTSNVVVFAQEVFAGAIVQDPLPLGSKRSLIEVKLYCKVPRFLSNVPP